MARQRFIWPEFWEDEDVGRLSPQERLLFIALFSLADDDGRIKADPDYLRGLAFRYDRDITTEQVQAWRDRITQILPRSVRLYNIGGKDYIALLHWGRWQKPKYKVPSKLPPPPDAPPALSQEEFLDRLRSLQEQAIEEGALQPGPLIAPNEVRWRIFERYQQSCAICGDKYDLEIDHIIPQSAGGRGVEANTALLCKTCNRRKRDLVLVSIEKPQATPASAPEHSRNGTAQTGSHDIPATVAIQVRLEQKSTQPSQPYPGNAIPGDGSPHSVEPSPGNRIPGDGSSEWDRGLGWDGMGSDREEDQITNDHRPTPAPSARPQRGRVRAEYAADFEAAWAIYPRKVAKRAAYKAWQARLHDQLDDGRPITPLMLQQATDRYAEECRRERRDVRYILHPATFWGPSHRFADYLEDRQPERTERPIDRWLRGVLRRDPAGGGRPAEGAAGCVPA